MPERMVQIIIQSLKWLLSGGVGRSLDKVMMSPFCKIRLCPRIELIAPILPSHGGLERHCPKAGIQASASPSLYASGKQQVAWDHQRFCGLPGKSVSAQVMKCSRRSEQAARELPERNV